MYKNVHLFFTSKTDDRSIEPIKKNASLLARIKTFIELNVDFLAAESNLYMFDMKASPLPTQPPPRRTRNYTKPPSPPPPLPPHPPWFFLYPEPLTPHNRHNSPSSKQSALLDFYSTSPDHGLGGLPPKRVAEFSVADKLVTLCATLNEYPYVRFDASRGSDSLPGNVARTFHREVCCRNQRADRASGERERKMQGS